MAYLGKRQSHCCVSRSLQNSFGGIMRHKPLEERFLNAFTKDGPEHPVLKTKCWKWLNKAIVDGYGVIGVNFKQVRAHRFSYVYFVGPIPEGLFVLHKCDNRRCVNPEHLFLGTNQDNMTDKCVKGRHRGSKGDANGARKYRERLQRGDQHFSRRTPELMAVGERLPQSKLTKEIVLEIRRLYISVRSFKLLAEKFSVSGATIARVIKRQSWKHVK